MVGVTQRDSAARHDLRLAVQPGNRAICRLFLGPFNAAVASLAVKGMIAKVRDAGELETAITAQAREPNGSLVVMPDTFMTLHRAKITALANQHMLPALYPFRFYSTSGGLLSYGNDSNDSFRRAAAYADRILKGAKASELPVQAPVKFELVINVRTARALGLDVPMHLQQRADEVIE